MPSGGDKTLQVDDDAGVSGGITLVASTGV
jgi:hypothetical protein